MIKAPVNTGAFFFRLYTCKLFFHEGMPYYKDMSSFYLIDAGTVLSCEKYDGSPELLLIGLFAIVFGVLFLSGWLIRIPYELFKKTYKDIKKRKGVKAAREDLGRALMRYAKPVFMTLSIVGFSGYIALNAVMAIVALWRSGCF